MKHGAMLVLGLLLGFSVSWIRERRDPPSPSTVIAAGAAGETVVAAAQGRVEGHSEEIAIGASMDGVIQTLTVKEGQRVARGEILATLACDELGPAARALEAEREGAEQARIRLRRGSREEERAVARESVAGAWAMVEQARRQEERMRTLVAQGDVSRNEAELAKRDLEVAESSWKAAGYRERLTLAGPLPEELAKADAAIRGVEERLQAAIAQREKCVIHSPMQGTVTRIHLRQGEPFRILGPRAILSLADLSERRIRAEVDERYLTRLKLGQRVRMRAEGFAEPFGGKVVWMATVMGRKTARGTDPAEKADRDVLETVIAPDGAQVGLPVGLRVVAEFLGK